MKSAAGIAFLLLSASCVVAMLRVDPVIIPREDWGAKAPTNTGGGLEEHSKGIVRIVISHSGSSGDYDSFFSQDGATVMKNIQNQGQVIDGDKADGAYNYVIAPADKEGTTTDAVNAEVYELREAKYKPAVVGDKNDGSLSIAFMGNYAEGENTLTGASKTAAINLVAKLVKDETLDCGTDVFTAATLIQTTAIAGVDGFLEDLKTECASAVARTAEEPFDPVPIIIGATAGVLVLGALGAVFYKKSAGAAAAGATEEPAV